MNRNFDPSVNSYRALLPENVRTAESGLGEGSKLIGNLLVRVFLGPIAEMLVRFRFADHRTNHRTGIVRVPDLELPCRRHKQWNKFSSDLFIHE